MTSMMMMPTTTTKTTTKTSAFARGSSSRGLASSYAPSSSSSSSSSSRRGGRVETTAFLNFGGGNKASSGASGAYVCVDCGYVFKGDFAALPRSYRCPTCNVGKNRFKPVGGMSTLAQKKANKEAFRAKRAAAAKKGQLTGREALKQKMMDAQREKDEKRGWF